MNITNFWDVTPSENTADCKYLPDYTMSYTETVHTTISFYNTLLKKRQKEEVMGR